MGDNKNNDRNFIDFSGLNKKLIDLGNDLENCKSKESTGIEYLEIRDRAWEIRKEYGVYLNTIDADKIHDIVMECIDILSSGKFVKIKKED
jgi:hypothetical protein